MEVPTIRIEDGKGGYIIINEADFDPGQHRRYEGEEEIDKALDESQDWQTLLGRLYDDRGYHPIRLLAEKLGIEKPETGWREAIPAIAAALDQNPQVYDEVVE